MSTGSLISLNLRKDLRLEWRAKDVLNAMAFFALLVVVIFSFAFEPTAEESRLIAGGIFWVAFLFAAIVALNQTWARESRHRVLDAYRVSGASPAALFLGKSLGNMVFVVAMEALVTPLFIIFYDLRVLGPLWMLPVLFFLGAWALVVNGTFFAALCLRTRNREVMLPLLLLPVSIPAVIAMVEGTTQALVGGDSGLTWVKLLAGYDVIFTTVGLLLFGAIFNAE